MTAATPVATERRTKKPRILRRGVCFAGLQQARHGRGRTAHRFENWKLLRAFLKPYFFRSTIRSSRVR